MNAKTCKRIRHWLRRRHVAWNEVQYRRHNRSGVISLNPACGRAQYQAAKKPLPHEV